MFTASFLRGWEDSEEDLESISRDLGRGRLGDCHPDRLASPGKLEVEKSPCKVMASQAAGGSLPCRLGVSGAVCEPAEGTGMGEWKFREGTVCTHQPSARITPLCPPRPVGLQILP